MGEIPFSFSEEERKEIIATNNFWTYLPDDNCPPIGGKPKIRPGERRGVMDRNGKIDVLITDCTGEHWKFCYSELFLGQTWREFFLTIDRIVDQFRIKDELQALFDIRDDPESDIVKRVRDSYEIAIGDDRVPIEVRLKALEDRGLLNSVRDEAIRLSLPVFKRLLEMGYNRQDLSK